MGGSLPEKQFEDEDAARIFLEARRWPDGAVVCPHCEAGDGAFRVVGKSTSATPARKGMWKCAACRKQFTVTVGTILQYSRIELHKWLRAFSMLCSEDYAVTAYRLHQSLGITNKSAWLVLRRIRHAMSKKPLSSQLPRGAARRPLTLAPLGFEEAVAYLLKVRPESKQDRLDALDRAAAEHWKSLEKARQREKRRAGSAKAD